MAIAWKLRASTVVLRIVLLGCCIFSLSVAEHKARNTDIIGIDLGTSYSRVGIYNNESFEIIADHQGNRETPSWVAFTDSERLIGEAAKNQAAANPERTIFNVKRLIGRKFEDEEVQRHMKLVPYKVVNKEGKPYIQVQIKDGETKVFSPEEISAMILTKMKETAEAYLGKEIKDAVISVPYYFTCAQKRAIKEACAIAGLDVERFAFDLSSAAISIGLEKKVEKNILIFGLGGGSFEVSILTGLEDGVFEVLDRSGDSHPGGEDFDQRIVEHFIEMIKEKHGKDISKDNRALGQLRREAKRAKRALSTQHEVHVEIESLLDGVDFSETLTRARFEELNSDLFGKIMAHVEKALEDSGLKKNQIDEIVLVGGSTRIPKIRQLLKDYFDGKEPNKDVNHDEAVAYGAAFLGDQDFQFHNRLKMDDRVIGYEVTHLAYGIETVGGVMSTLIPKYYMTPAKKSQVFTTHQDQQTTVTIQVFACEEGNLTKDCRFLGMFDLTGIKPAPRGTPQIEVTFEMDANYFLNVKAEDKGSGRSDIRINMGHLSQDEMDARKERLDAKNGLVTYTGSPINDEDKLEQSDKGKIETATKEALEWLKRIVKFWTRSTKLLDDEHEEEL